MEEVKGTNIPATVVPFTTDDKYPTHSEEYGRGGYRSVNTVAQMNAIPAERRKEGMLVNVVGGDKYELKNGVFVKVDFGGSGGSSSSTPNLDIEIKTERMGDGTSALFFKIKEIHENGYIQFLKKKRQIYQTSSGKKKIVKYAVNGLSYGSIPGISVGNLQPNIWYEYPQVNRDNLIGRYLKGTSSANGTTTKANTVRFMGNVHANPIKYASTADNATSDKRTSVLHMGLQYNIINPNYKSRIRENGKMPKTFLQNGKMQKFVGRIRAGNIFSYSPILYLSVE